MKRLQNHLGIVLILALALGTVLPAQAPASAENATTVSRQQSSTQPRRIVGTYFTTNPIYPAIGADTAVVLYDMAGEITENYAFFPPEDAQVLGQMVGTVTNGSYTITLPDVPQGTPLDFDDDTATPPAVQVYSPATFIDVLGDEYVNRGETPLNLSVRIESLTYDMIGGYVVVWSDVEGAQFPGALGTDGTVFSEDDPLMALPYGWSVIALDTEPFTIIRDETVQIPMFENMGALNDYSELSYSEAWQKLFERTRATYPFAVDKNVDWDAIYNTITPLVQQADTDLEFHLVMANFGSMIPDTHIGYVSLLMMQAFLLGGVGIRQLAVTDAGEVVVMDVGSKSPAQRAGIDVGTVLDTVDGVPALQALDETPMILNSASTLQSRRYFQAALMLQGPVGSALSLAWHTSDGTSGSAELTRISDVMALIKAFDSGTLSANVITSRMLASGVGYISVAGFAQQVSLADAWFSDALQELIDQGAKGIILDVRGNGGGLVSLSMAMAGHFFTDYERLFDFYYADGTGDFAYRGFIEILKNAPYYDGPVAVLVDEMTGSGGDMFAYAMATNDRALIVGHTPTGGFTGEISDGQYSLPGGLTIQIPTGRPVDPVDGSTLLEGVGVAPDIRVPLTMESLLSGEDEVLRAAEEALLAQ